MKKTTRLTALALSALMALSLTACGGNSAASSAPAASGSAASAPAAEETYEIGYVNLADTDVFCMARETALNAEIEGTNFKVSYTDGNNDNQKQIDQTNAFLAKGVDALILVPADSEAIVPAINAASGNGTPVSRT